MNNFYILIIDNFGVSDYIWFMVWFGGFVTHLEMDKTPYRFRVWGWIMKSLEAAGWPYDFGLRLVRFCYFSKW